jgi:hypothetical protein
MILSWVSATVPEAQQRFRRIRGYKEMKRLITALEQIEQKHETTGISRSHSKMNGVAAH